MRMHHGDLSSKILVHAGKLQQIPMQTTVQGTASAWWRKLQIWVRKLSSCASGTICTWCWRGSGLSVLKLGWGDSKSYTMGHDVHDCMQIRWIQTQHARPNYSKFRWIKVLVGQTHCREMNQNAVKFTAAKSVLGVHMHQHNPSLIIHPKP